MSQEQMNAARAAQGRAKIWGLMVRVFVNVPDNALIAEIKGPGFRGFLNACTQLGDETLAAGIREIIEYLDMLDGSNMDAAFTELTADRARLFRSSANSNFKPPYENLYRPNPGANKVAADLREIYRRENLLPDEINCELPDYLGVELEFVYRLVQREAEEWAKGNALAAAVAEEEFLRVHLGSWFGNYAAEARQSAGTGFYRGFLTMLEAFVGLEKDYLSGLTGKGDKSGAPA